VTSLSKKIYIISFAAALLTVLAAPRAMSAKEQPVQDGNAYNTEVIARVDGIEITRLQLVNTVNKLLPSAAFHQSIPEKRYEKAQKEAMEQLILNELVYKSAKEQKLDQADSKEIDSLIEDVKKMLAEGDTLKKVLERSDMTMEELREDFKQSIVVRELRKKKHEEFKAQASATVNDEYILDYYDENPEKFKVPEQIRLRNILLKADRSGGQRVWNSVKKKALELEERARGGEDFAELARQYSEGPNAANGGDMGWAHRGSRLEELDYAASKLKKGEISGPIMTIYGYHLLKIEDIRPSLLKKFEDLNKPMLKKELEKKEYKRLLESWKTGLMSRANIEYLRELY
jgi:parvulin-like peptidyl-prolyl isomerase